MLMPLVYVSYSTATSLEEENISSDATDLIFTFHYNS